MKKVLLFVFALALVLSPVVSYASGNNKTASANTNSIINPKTFKMIPEGRVVVRMRLHGTNIVYPANTFERFYDPQTNVMCYADVAGTDQQGGFSCVQLSQKK
ncbi:MAG: hypothetical protein ACYCTB_10795 [bacterium]